MKNVSISLTDQHAAELEAAVASGDYASVSEVVRAALREFLQASPRPTAAEMKADFEEIQASLAAGETLLESSEALTHVSCFSG